MTRRSSLAALASALAALGSLPQLQADQPPGCTDSGIFSEYDTRTELRALCPGRSAGPELDTDRDGIADPLDVARGARKAALNGAAYQSSYLTLPYPGGDVPRSIGVCTDVIVRAMRNAGIDLQKEQREDIVRRPRSYPWIARPDSSIDHRRVRNLLPLFEQRFESRSALPAITDADPQGYADWKPGDIVFLDTFPDRPGVEHVGVVSERFASDHRPMIINNWTDGYHTQDMDLLSFVKPVKRFRPLPRI